MKKILNSVLDTTRKKISQVFITSILALIINTNICFAQYTKIHDFSYGSEPTSSLISDGTFFYGTTEFGGSSNQGTLYKIKSDGTGYQTIFDFTGLDGSHAVNSPFWDGTFLYVTTYLGGTNNVGVLIKIKPDGTGYIKLRDFNNSAGSAPYGSLISDGTFLYGITRTGGSSASRGTIYKIEPDGTGYVKLLTFNGTNGSYPYNSLISDGTFLYGMTNMGGTSDMGVVFKVKHDGTGYQKLFDFNGTVNGAYPRGSLIFDGTFLYGTTYKGGTSDLGTVFKIKPDGTGYVKLLDFTGTINGSNPECSLIFDGTFLYGTTNKGGASNIGTVFKIKPDGTSYLKLLDFLAGTDGYTPKGSLISDSTFLYGVTLRSGINGKGTIFKIKDCTTEGIDQQTSCGSYTWIDGNTYDTSNTTASHVLTNASGCDSIITLNLIINDLATGVNNTTICNNEDVIINGTTYNESNPTGTEVFVNAGANGCDSIVIVNLLTHLTGTNNTTICNNEDVVINGTIYNASNPIGTEVFTNVGSNNCDSIVSIALNVLPILTGIDSTTICATGSIVINGTTYDASTPTGTEVFANVGPNNCDSIVSVALNVLAEIDVTVTNSSPTLTANQTGATTYQWLDCDNSYALIPSETTQSFTATVNGNYAVEVTVGVCSEISVCENITGVSVKEITPTNVLVYPNPTNGLITINFGNTNTILNYSILSIEGKEIEVGKTTSSKLILDLSNQNKGVYFIKVNTENTATVYRVIKGIGK